MVAASGTLSPAPAGALGVPEPRESPDAGFSGIPCPCIWEPLDTRRQGGVCECWFQKPVAVQPFHLRGVESCPAPRLCRTTVLFDSPTSALAGLAGTFTKWLTLVSEIIWKLNI